MSRLRNPPILVLLAVITAALVYGGLRGLGYGRGDLEAPPVPAGDQEVAWIHAATSGPSWERFVAGVHRARRDCPELQVDDSRAFLDQTTAIPEVVLGKTGASGRLRIRWYKLTSETPSARWVRTLARRDPPPLAFIGGGSSDRAVDLALALAEQKDWAGVAPLLLITTATANTIVLDADRAPPGEPGPKRLMDIYPGRSFRFCFTNEQMAQAVVDFVWSQPDLRPYGNPLPAIAAAAAPDPWTAISLLAAQAKTFPPSAAALEWDDDPYSVDLSTQFKLAFHESQWPDVLVRLKPSIPFSVGGFDRPNTWEAAAAEMLLREQWSPWERQLLVLPAGPAAARRVLRALTGAAPLAGRNLVAIGGDSMNINTVYRDADIAWNVRSLPVPFVFFAHQNPVAWDEEQIKAGSVSDGRRTGDSSPSVANASGSDLLPPNGTDDVLLHADLLRRLAEGAFQPSGLMANADGLADRLRERQPAFFDPSGDRQGGRGEFVVCLRPQIIDAEGPAAQVLAAATLDVWTRRDATASRWQLVKRLVIDYDRATRPAP
ncbi:MAG TPA: hypothetical protein VL371_24760 [Gemmataceae bacterium]|jgi:hypothetical protein|nr:hypothetical protein [Gemmataceae bacterium]